MGSVQATIDWRTATPEELDGHRCIITTVDGTIIDGYLKAIPPFTPPNTSSPGSCSTTETSASDNCASCPSTPNTALQSSNHTSAA